MGKFLEIPAHGLDGRPYRVDIYDARYSGTVNQVTGSDQFVSFDGGERDDNSTHPIWPRELRVFAYDDVSLTRLSEATDTTFRVEVYQTDTGRKVFKGFLLPEFFEDAPYSRGATVVQLRAYDGLPTLKNKSLGSILSGAGQGFTSVVDGIASILLELYQFEAPDIEFATNLYPDESTLNDFDVNPLDHVGFAADNYQEDRSNLDTSVEWWNQYQVLKDLLVSNGLILRQAPTAGGDLVWQIRHPGAILSNGDLKVWRYDAGGNLRSGYPTFRDISRDFNAEGFDPDHSRSHERAWQSVAYTHDHLPIDAVVENSGFEAGSDEWTEFDDSGEPWFWQITDHANRGFTPDETQQNKKFLEIAYNAATDPGVVWALEQQLGKVDGLPPQAWIQLSPSWGLETKFSWFAYRIEVGGYYVGIQTVKARDNAAAGTGSVPVEPLPCPIPEGAVIDINYGDQGTITLSQRAEAGDEKIVGEVSTAIDKGDPILFLGFQSAQTEVITDDLVTRDQWGERSFRVAREATDGTVVSGTITLRLGAELNQDGSYNDPEFAPTYRMGIDDAEMAYGVGGSVLDQTTVVASVAQFGKSIGQESRLNQGPTRSNLARLQGLDPNGDEFYPTGWGIGTGGGTFSHAELQARERLRLFREQRERLTLTFEVREGSPDVFGHELVKFDGKNYRVSQVKYRPYDGRLEVTLLEHTTGDTSGIAYQTLVGQSESGGGGGTGGTGGSGTSAAPASGADSTSPQWEDVQNPPDQLFARSGDSDGYSETISLADTDINGALGYTAANANPGTGLASEPNSTLGIADQGVGTAQLDTSVAGNGLTGGGGSALSVDPSLLAGDGLQEDGSENFQVAPSDFAGDGLTTSGRDLGVDATVARTDQNETFDENVTVTGNLFVNGDEVIQSTETVEVQDNLLLLNAGETGTGVTRGTVGFEADRGTSPPIKLVFDESDDTGRVGVEYRTLNYSSLNGGPFQLHEEVVGGTSGAEGLIWYDDGSGTMRIKGRTGTFSAGETLTGQTSGATATLDSVDTYDQTQRLATVEDAPTDDHVMVWDSTGEGRMAGSTDLTFDGTTLSVTEDVSVSRDLSVGRNATITQDLTVDRDATVAESLTFGTTLASDGFAAGSDGLQYDEGTDTLEFGTLTLRGGGTFGGVIDSDNYASGFSGSGIRLDPGNSFMETTDLSVRGTLTAREFEIRKITHTKGPIVVGVGGGKVDAVSDTSDGADIKEISFADNHGFADTAGQPEPDYILVQEVDPSDQSVVYQRDGRVYEVVDKSTAKIDFSVGDNTKIPAVGDDIVQVASADSDRDSMLFLQPFGPYLDALDGLSNLAEWSNRTPLLRLGKLGGAPDLDNGLQPSGVGLYSGTIFSDHITATALSVGDVKASNLPSEVVARFDGVVDLTDGSPLGRNPEGETFTYDGLTHGHYAIEWDAGDSDGSPRAHLSGFQGVNLYTNGSPSLVVQKFGDVGIGETNPNEALHVNGQIQAGEATGQQIRVGSLYQDGAGGLPTTSYPYIYSLSGPDWDSGEIAFAARSSAVRGLRFYSGNGSGPVLAQYISPSGNVGINTDSPTSPLYVDGAITAEAPANSPSGSQFSVTSPGGNLGIVLKQGDGGGGVARRWDIRATGDSLLLRDDTGGNDSLALKKNGRVAVGFLSPERKLDVFGDFRCRKTVEVHKGGQSRGDALLKLKRGSDGKDNAGVVLKDDGASEERWYAGIPYDCGSNTDDYVISTQSYRDDCTNTHTPEFVFQSDGGGQLGIRKGYPSAALDVGGDAIVGGTLDVGEIDISGGVSLDGTVVPSSHNNGDFDPRLNVRSNGLVYQFDGSTAPYRVYLQNGTGRVWHTWNAYESGDEYYTDVGSEGTSAMYFGGNEVKMYVMSYEPGSDDENLGDPRSSNSWESAGLEGDSSFTMFADYTPGFKVSEIVSGEEWTMFTQGQAFIISHSTGNGNLFDLESGGDLIIDGSLTENGTPSDESTKANMRALADPLGTLTDLEAYRFEFTPEEYRERYGEEWVGLSAQEVQEAIPHLVNTRGDGRLGIRLKHLHAYEVGAINQLGSRTERLEAEVRRLQSRVSELESQLND